MSFNLGIFIILWDPLYVGNENHGAFVEHSEVLVHDNLYVKPPSEPMTNFQPFLPVQIPVSSVYLSYRKP